MKCKWVFFHDWCKWTRPLSVYNGDFEQYAECKDCGRVKSKKAPFSYNDKANAELREELENE